MNTIIDFNRRYIQVFGAIPRTLVLLSRAAHFGTSGVNVTWYVVIRRVNCTPPVAWAASTHSICHRLHAECQRLIDILISISLPLACARASDHTLHIYQPPSFLREPLRRSISSHDQYHCCRYVSVQLECQTHLAFFAQLAKLMFLASRIFAYAFSEHPFYLDDEI